jgi:hypothetical protein
MRNGNDVLKVSLYAFTGLFVMVAGFFVLVIHVFGRTLDH